MYVETTGARRTRARTPRLSVNGRATRLCGVARAGSITTLATRRRPLCTIAAETGGPACLPCIGGVDGALCGLHLDLNITHRESGKPCGPPVLLLCGFLYDVRAHTVIAPRMAWAGVRVANPWPSEFAPPSHVEVGTPRAKKQAALADDRDAGDAALAADSSGLTSGLANIGSGAPG